MNFATSDAASDTSASSGDSDELNDRVIPLLVGEFGVLAEDGEEERLLFESDGAYFQDVAILGVIHLTTHRITFHASLLSTRPDLLSHSQVIKSGPVLVHRSGLHRKRRLWMELYHDMLCTFPDSTDEGRVRPLFAMLLSNVKEVKPLDPASPKSVKVVFRTKWGTKNGHVEYDTHESAASWRRELTTALHNLRQSRNTLFKDEDSGEGSQSGVRISIPLHRVESFESRTWGNFANVVTFSLTAPGGTSESSSIADVQYTSQPSEPNETIRDLKDRGYRAESHRNSITAKERRVKTPATLDSSDQVVVDFGELAIMNMEEAKPETGAQQGSESRDPAEVARRKFALPEGDDLWHARAAVGRFTISVGYIVVTPRFVCFWSKGFISDTQLRFHVHDINSAHQPEEKRKCDGVFHRMVLEIKGHKDIMFTFRSEELRDDAMKRINAAAKEAKAKMASKRASLSPVPDSVATLVASSAMAATAPLASSPQPATPTSSTAPSATEQLASVSRILERSATRIIPTELLAHLPRPINIPADKQLHVQKQHFVCLTIGSRGDIQPYIALCLGLKKEGHEVTIVTHEEYKAWVEGFGIQHRTAGGDPGALMKLSVEHKMFSPQFFKESLGNFRKWLDELLVDSYDQVKAAGATVLIESPSAMAGVHIAEALNIPYFRAFTMPWSRTAEYPHAFISPPDFVAGSFNFSTYVLFDNVFWRATAPQINPWRKKHLGLPSTDLEHLAQTKIPFLYNFSQNVVPKPLDWSDTTIITGYWFLDNPDLGWKPSQSLQDFIAKARADGKPLVYIGFGSIVVENPKAMTRSIVKAVLKSDVRAILNKGWSARMASSNDNEPEVEIPPEVYEVDKIPHDWLFPQIDAALHHGGAGTTGASLRAGIPTLIKPWFGDQFFWAARVQKLGAGLRVPSLSSSDLAHALTKATSDRVIREKAQAVGEKVRSENGVATAIQSLYMYLHRAGIRPEHKRSKSSATSAVTSQQQQQQHPQEKQVGGRQPNEYSFLEVACDAITPSAKHRPVHGFSFDSK
ncbi:glycosyltransferase family 1 protein [Tulasnella calospora MUT 4182]|uniref:sterol 3beta-glucosyltransferase n=1 Tax=Tulasnella calospora MUT 4182 TaxID=1051891 RepID=A0A0C3LJ31_9AGAM|nr:glycosyltransferase family 1 protein [Tulasnella calospora MUT 4182]